MSGIVHKESLPAQGRVKRRRVDVSLPEGTANNATDATSHASAVVQSPGGDVAQNSTAVAAPQKSGTAASLSSSGVAEASKASPASADSSSSSSSSDDEDESDNEVERENARLAKLREQRSRRHEQSGSGDGTFSSAAAGKPSTGQASPSTSSSGNGSAGTNSYDHDVLFRNAAWRTNAKATTAEEKQKEKWNAVLNRTQDSTAHRHFMKNFFK